MRRGPNSLYRRLQRRRQPWRSIRLWIFLGILSLVVSWLIQTSWMVAQNRDHPVDAIFVLGGGIYREVRAAELRQWQTEIPILISKGSDDPCIVQIFQEMQTSMQNVWLETCANSTFENFFFSVPILKSWGVKKVQLITSARHLPRAQWLAKILLGARGIALEMDIVNEKGIPGNKESPLKTILDVTRSLMWAPWSQFLRPPCSQVKPLETVATQYFIPGSYECEYRPETSLQQ
ncbi:MAG: YdcF family protein [Cyanobacteria bacterium P01_H01_bin.15]